MLVLSGLTLQGYQMEEGAEQNYMASFYVCVAKATGCCFQQIQRDQLFELF